MRNDDIRADNLFCRLFSYTPRENRTALEDFCTEALAWCLRRSPEFRKKFLDLLQDHLTDGRPFPSGLDLNKLRIETQFGFSGEGETGETKAGRFDLRISSDDSEFCLVVEVKVDSDFGPNQIDSYREHLKKHKCGFLVSLTNRRVP
ncbi:MAG TPA: PD-(D/E)XK nuclease family protein, partial [Verrucomicrobiae bacterium]|nr:PD-(D/E)XK nuclease family protein [Verrucomicrobiae bacterium]